MIGLQFTKQLEEGVPGFDKKNDRSKDRSMFAGEMECNPSSNDAYSTSLISASGAFFFTDSMPFMQPDFDS
jgi:hypothetical protein